MDSPSTHVNIDGDVIRYSCGFASEGEPMSHMLATVKSKIKHIVKASKAETYTVLLTRDGNFREQVATLQPYKGNRKGNRKPDNYEDMTEYLAVYHNGWFVDGEEADDQLGIRCVANGDTIATIDKDLDNVPGWHYNWQTDKLYYVTELQAMRHFYTQMLTGDAIDHIPGLYKLTGRRASKKLKQAVQECTTKEEAYAHVFMSYREACDETNETIKAWLLEIGRLLWIRHEENQLWTPPIQLEIPE
jgi:hypothetical protein